MSVFLGISLSPSLSRKAPIIAGLSEYLRKKFTEFDFPQQVETVGIGVIIVEPKFDDFFKVRKPRLKEAFRDRNSGELITNNFEYDIKFDYEEMRLLDDNQFLQCVKDKLKESVTVIEENIGALLKDKKLFEDLFIKSIDEYLIVQ